MPEKPTNVVIVSDRNQPQPRLTWQDNANNEIQYKVRRFDLDKRPSDLRGEEFFLPKDSTEFIDTTAVPGHRYSYFISAINDVGGLQVAVLPNITAFMLGTGNMTEKDDMKVMQYIGYGYNVFKNYATTDSTTRPVLDVNRLIEDRHINRKPLDMGEYDEVTGESSYQYCKKTSNELSVSGGYMGFSGSVNTNFGKQEETVKNRYYSTIYYWIRQYELFLDDPNLDLAKYLVPHVRLALDNPQISPEQIFRDYGTHVLLSVRAGGRLEYNTSINSEYNESFETFKLSAQAGFNFGFAGAKIKYGSSSQTSSTTFEKESKRSVRSYGGTSQHGLTMSTEEAAKTLSGWQQSLVNDPTFCDFGGQEPKPIWEFCTSDARAKQLKQAFEKQARTNESVLTRPQYVTDIVFVADGNADNARRKCPPGYFLIDKDLNAGAGGDFIYLTYKLGENAGDGYTDFYARKSEGWALPERYSEKVTHNGHYAEYWRFPLDLNKGTKKHSGGDALVFWTKAPGLVPIKKVDVMIVSPHTPNHVVVNDAGKDWKVVTWFSSDTVADLNNGAGGQLIFIKYLR